MDQPIRSSLNNSTKVPDNVYSDEATVNSTVQLPTTVTAVGGQSMSLTLVRVIGIVIFVTGISVNALVLAVLFRARKQFGKGVHVLIANQSAMGLYASVFGTFNAVVSFSLTNGYKYGHNRIADDTVCILIEGAALASTGIIAEKLGLMVITLERYFKIVHAIAHRKYYRDWMTKVGVALPWIGGICFTLIPNMFTTRVVNGRCIKLGVWPNKAMATVSYICLSFA